MEILPGRLQTVAVASPATYVIEGLRGCLLRGRPTIELLPTASPLLGAGIGVIAFGLFIFRCVETHAKRSGRLKRNG